MPKILAFSGKKQSGKNTALNYMIGYHMRHLGIVKGAFDLNEKGMIRITDLGGDESCAGIFDVTRRNNNMIKFLYENIYPYIRPYSFADLLKQQVCINILGLDWDQCYGSNEKKNEETHLNWENMPGIIVGLRDELYMQPEQEYQPLANVYISEYDTIPIGIYHEPGPMTAREVMQFLGTEIFRKMYSNVWVDSLIKQIHIENSLIAIITDCRFPNEVEGVQKNGGKVVRFTRAPFSDDEHESEKALDRDRFDWHKFDIIIDNADMTISEQNDAVYDVLYGFGYFPQAEVKEKVTT